MTNREKTDAILRDIFAKGGPMRPSYSASRAERQQRAVYGRPHVCNVLEAEQRRLIRLWEADGYDVLGAK